jgi:hypothetical protein
LSAKARNAIWEKESFTGAMKKIYKDLKWERVKDRFEVAIKGFAFSGDSVCWKW